MAQEYTFTQDSLGMLLDLAASGKGGGLIDAFKSGDEATIRKKALTETLLYGGGGMFSVCAPDALINASLNDDGFASAIPWMPTTDDVRRQAAITSIGDLAGGSQPADQCADPPGSNWKGCELEWCLGRIRAKSPEYDRLDLGTRWCNKFPVYRMFGAISIGGQQVVARGSRIQNDAEWGAVAAAIHIRQTLGRWLYTGNPASNPNMFRGLQLLINTGYVDFRTHITCGALDSKVENYENDCIGDPDSTKNIVNYLEAVVQRIVQRARDAGLGMPRAQDFVLLMRTEMAEALYTHYACNIGPCGTGSGAALMTGATTPSQIQIVSADWARSTAESMRNRNVLRVYGMDLPVVTDDYMPFTTLSGGRRVSDIYILLRQISGMPILFGEYQNFNAGVGDAMTGFTSELYGGRVVDGGRFYVWQDRTNTCFDTRVAVKPRLIAAAPFLQGRITNVCAEPLNPPLSAYPPDGTPYYPDGGTYEAWYDAGDCH